MNLYVPSNSIFAYALTQLNNASHKHFISQHTDHETELQIQFVFYHLRYSCIPKAKIAQKAFCELDQDHAYIKSAWRLVITYLTRLWSTILYATFKSSEIPIIFWQIDSMNKFSPSEHEARRSNNFNNICKSGSESLALSSNRSLYIMTIYLYNVVRTHNIVTMY